ncbi:TRAP transporter substrate-binding protein [Allosediminivita pacifica]|uniref:TRAP-type C4-dicarboxylate transport system substrate-binding protein n=1 Tax=Allosediminivita pacifica TaxID=1267769 RepID=A0A2T6B423_9RHOB|nr:TRAP transporter substrate-binding protein [Allosediminivita pacifica]PTX50814.1 TRAP-type C4-dicarboxylate transport system substrate-binding protein [Allosediminivita pacifica]GGB01367.1 C4-dicarboxylate ABC transporter substrate-binding protein [Allosediminivita pacifica]
MQIRKVVAGAALAVTAAFAAQAEELKFASFTPPFHTINASVIEQLNEDLSAATDGELTVRGYHGGELGAGPVEQYVRAVQGAADMVWGLPGYTSSQFGKTMIVEMPNAIPLDTPGYEALWAAYEDHLKSEFPATKPLALWTSEPNIFIMKDAVIRQPSDLEGLKVRVAGSTAAKVAEALGATPVQMPINQVYNALQTGLIDGVITGGSTLADFRLDEVANSYTLGANLGRLAFYTVMGQGAYDALSDEHKAAIDEAAGMALSKSAEEGWYATSDAAIEAAREAGDNTFVDLSEEEAQAFEDAVADVVDAYVSDVNGEDALAAMRGE